MKLSDITPATPIPTHAECYQPDDPLYYEAFSEFEPQECQCGCEEYFERLYQDEEGYFVSESCLLREVNKANAEPLMTYKLMYGGVI